MSLKIFALLLAVAVGISHAKPATADNADVETFGTFPGNDRWTPGFGDWGFFNLPDFSAIHAYINRLRQSIASSFAGAFQGIDLSKGNTTSETKIVDGNRVTINQTVIDEDGVNIVIRNVEVRPVDDGNSTHITGSTPALPGKTTRRPPKEDLETFQDKDNEHGKSKESLENFDQIDFVPHNNLDIETMDEFPVEGDLTHDIDVNKMAKRHYNDQDVEEFDVNAVNNGPTANRYQQIEQVYPKNVQPKEQDVEEVFHDLSGDTYVNDLLARKLESAGWEHRQKQPVAYQGYQVYPEDVTNYRDLSRDTYVNELAARRGVPKNPDAEELDIEVFSPGVLRNNALRKRHS